MLTTHHAPPHPGVARGPSALADDPICKGLIAKNSKQSPRFAIRFSNIDDIEIFTKAKELPSFINTSRWRLEGLAPSIGAAGVIQFLEAKHWVVHELLYFGERHCVFTATKMGAIEPMHYRHSATGTQQIRFKALNSLARKDQEAASKSTRSAASNSGSQTTASTRKTAFLKTLKSTAAPKIKGDSPKSKTQDTKRPAEGSTGQTPPPKKTSSDA